MIDADAAKRSQMMETKQPRNLYDLVPRQRRKFEERADGNVDVLLPRYGENAAGRLLRWVFNNKPVRVQLDDVGTTVWYLCDGRRSVHEIARSLEGRFGDRLEPLHERLGQFLQQMHKAELIEWAE